MRTLGSTAVIGALLIGALSRSVLGKMRPDQSDASVVVPYMRFNNTTNSSYLACISGI